jgi:hypothetical protein
MDEPMAWTELDRFATRAKVKLDERARPEAADDGSISYPNAPSAEDLEKQSAVRNYDTLLEAIMTGRATVGADGDLTYAWHSPPMKSTTVQFTPATWPYAKAVRVASLQTVVGSSTGAHTQPQEDKIGNLMGALEVLGKVPAGSISERLSDRDDVIFVTSLAALVLSE